MTEQIYTLKEMFPDWGGLSPHKDVSPLCKSPSVWATFRVQSRGHVGAPLFYLRRPKWIKSDSDWKVIVKTVFDNFQLPKDFTVTTRQEES